MTLIELTVLFLLYNSLVRVRGYSDARVLMSNMQEVYVLKCVVIRENLTCESN